MGDVIKFDLAAKDADHTTLHLQGPAVCTDCGHEWRAVTEVGDVANLECPNCHLNFGVTAAPVVPDQYWECNCGSVLFYLTRDGAQCRKCGLVSNDWVSV